MRLSHPAHTHVPRDKAFISITFGKVLPGAMRIPEGRPNPLPATHVLVSNFRWVAEECVVVTLGLRCAAQAGALGPACEGPSINWPLRSMGRDVYCVRR
jgi:hypothetical protein